MEDIMEDKDLKEKLIDEFNESGESNFADFVKRKEDVARENGDEELASFYHKIYDDELIYSQGDTEYAEYVQDELNYKNYLERVYPKYYREYSEQNEHYKSFEQYIESKVAALNYEDFASDSELEKELWDILKLYNEKEEQKAEQEQEEARELWYKQQEIYDEFEAEYESYFGECGYRDEPHLSYKKYIRGKIEECERTGNEDRKQELEKILQHHNAEVNNAREELAKGHDVACMFREYIRQEDNEEREENSNVTELKQTEPVEEELDYIESAYSDYYSEFLSSDYESFEEYIWAKIGDLESWETSRKDVLFEVLDLYKKQKVQTEKRVEDSVSLEDMTIEELIEAATRNQGTINENDQVIKDALIKRILSQQQQISEQEEEINRLKGQKVK